ncbi:EAL domain-containing protein [Marinobacteraceae bacterium S3BR75-40.1]
MQNSTGSRVSGIARQLSTVLNGKEPFDVLIRNLLKATREYLGMEVAFVSQFVEGLRVFRYVDSDESVKAIRVGDSDPLDESYCQRVVLGRLPGWMRDARFWPAARELDITWKLPIGGFVSVPIVLSDGGIYGTFCCLSRMPKPNLSATDHAYLTVFAEVTAALLEENWETMEGRHSVRRDITAILEQDQLSTFFQPIVSFSSQRMLGFEALSRVEQANWPPDVLFSHAARVGMEEILSERAIEKTLQAMDSLDPDSFISINLSPEVVVNFDPRPLLARIPSHRIVLEVTEHTAVEDYDTLSRALEPLRAAGMRLAVDDAGAGYASFRHVLKLKPDIIKLDMSLSRHIDNDEQRQLLLMALVEFARRRGCQVLAEGVETEGERRTLQELGVDMGQGFLFARPQPASCYRGMKHVTTI